MAAESTTVLMDASDWSPRISFSHNTALLERISLPKENHPIPDFGFEFSSFLSADLQPFEQRMMPADELFCNGKLRPLARRCENASDIGMVQNCKTNGKVGEGGRSPPKRTDWGETENMGDGGRSPRSREEKKKKMGDGRRSLSPRRGRDKEAEEEKKMMGDDGRCSLRDIKPGEAESGSDGGRGQSPTTKLGRAKAMKGEDERVDGTESANDDDGKAGKKKGWSSGGMKGATTKKSCSSSHIELLKQDMLEEEEDEEEMKKISRSPRCASMEMGGSFCKSRHSQHHHHRYNHSSYEQQQQQKQPHYHHSHHYHHHHQMQQQQWNPHHHHHFYHHHHHQILQPSNNRNKLLNRNSISLNNSRCTSPSRSLSSSLPCTAPASPTTSSSSSSRFSATFFTSSSSSSSSSSSRYCHRVMDFLKLKKSQTSSSPRPLSSTSERSSSFPLHYGTATSSSNTTNSIKLGISSPRSFWPFSKPKTTTCPNRSSRSSRSFSTKSFHEDIDFCRDCCCVTKNNYSSSSDSCTTTPKNDRTNGCTTSIYSHSLTNPGLSPFPLSQVPMINKAARKSAGDQASLFMANGPTTDGFSGDELAWDCGCMKECTTSKASIALQHPYSINYLKQQQQQQQHGKYRMMNNLQQREFMMVGSRGIVGTKCMERSIPYPSSTTNTVRVTPILNVPGCMTPSLRKTKGSSKSKPLGFPNLFHTKKNVSMAYHLISNNTFDRNPLA